MGDDQAGMIAGNFPERCQDRALGLAVQRGGGLVKHHDGRAFENGAGYGHPLLFTAGQFQAAFTHYGIPARGQGADEIVQVSQPYRLLDFTVLRLGITVTHILENAVVEQHGILRNNADGPAQGGLAQLSNILAVDQNAACTGVVEPEK